MPLDQDLRIVGNLARHFKLSLYLRNIKNPEIIKKINPDTSESGFEVYHQYVPYPFLKIDLDHASHFHLMDYELLGHITHVSDHFWST